MNSGLDIYGGADPRDLPAYPLQEAARILAIPRATLRSWVNGRGYLTKDGRRASSALIVRPTKSEALSFTNLIEAYVLAAFRKRYKVKLPNIRSALRYVERELHVEHPLAREAFRTDGVDLFVRRVDQLINASRGGQIAHEFLEPYLDRVEYEDGRALRFYPLVRSEETAEQPRLIVIDPRRAFGAPVLRGTGIRASDVADRFRAGDSVELLAADFGVAPELVQEALRAAA